MKIHIEIIDERHSKLMKLKKRTGQSLNWLVNRAVLNYLKAKKILTSKE